MGQKPRELTSAEQVYELQQEFYEEAEKYKRHRSDIEDQMALNHIDGILDAYFALTVEVAWVQHASGEA